MKSLQNFEFNKSHYDRPTQKWTCGDKACGKECAKGPNNEGRCQTAHECQPYKEGDRWQCNRPLSQGGHCENGPLANGSCCTQRTPCKPVLNKRYIRGRLVMLAIVIGLTILTAYFYGASNTDFFSPGTLNSAHTQLQDNCQACHGTNLVKKFPDTNHHNLQAVQCLDCHTFNQHQLTPHNLVFDQAKENLDVSCSTCHQEHQGNVPILGAAKNDHCQGCHENTISRFSSNHPQFDQLASSDFNQHTLKFSHKAHQENYYFDAGEENFECYQCHLITNKSPIIASKHFDDTCRSCHQEDVTGEQLDTGLILWSSPAIDTDSMSLAPNWPEEALDEEADISLIQLWLMQKVSVEKNNYDLLVNDEIDLAELSTASPETIKSITDYMLNSKQILEDITNYDLQANKVLPPLIDAISPAITQAAYQHWFKSEEGDQKVEYKDLNHGGSFKSGMTIQYRPSGHADPLYKAIIEQLVIIDNKTEVEVRLLEYILDEETAGQCGKCHNISPNKTSNKQNNIWSAKKEESKDALHKFKHFTHSKDLNNLGCQQCHNADTTDEKIDFDSLNKAQCTSCHVEDKAGDDCMLCHRYHTEALTLSSNHSSP